MAEIIKLDDHRGQLDFEWPIVEPHNIPVIRKLKSKVGTLVGYSYLTKLVSLVKKGKNILSKENISGNNLPYNIEFHLNKMKPEEKLILSGEIGKIMKQISGNGVKGQLFYFRSKILASIKN